MNLSFLKRFDLYLALPLVLLSIFSFVVILSGDAALAKQHLFFGLVGLLLFFLMGLIDFSFLQRFPLQLFVLMLFLLVGVVFLGTEVRGSVRWLDIGPVMFQPSEPAKILFIVSLSAVLVRINRGTFRFLSVFVVAGMVGLAAVLVFLQPDLGTSLIFVATAMGLLFTTGVPLWFIGLSLVSGAGLLPFAWRFLRDYQKQRLFVFLDPHSDPLGTGYNVLQSAIAVGSGRLLGRGFGRGTQSQLRFLPEQHTDFIFATLAEEWGLLGVLILFLFFSLLLLRIIMIAKKSSSAFGTLVCMGVFYLLLTQILVNVGMNMGVMPVTGLPLPFVSYGGSAVISYFVALGLVHSVSIHTVAS